MDTVISQVEKVVSDFRSVLADPLSNPVFLAIAVVSVSTSTLLLASFVYLVDLKCSNDS